MSDCDWDEFIVCPTCRYIERQDEDEEDGHKQPCPDCGWPLMLVSYEIGDEGDVEVTTRWHQGEGARLFLEDAAKAIARVDEFVSAEEAEDDRIDEAMTDMRLARREQQED